MNLNIIYSVLEKLFEEYDFDQISNSLTTVHQSISQMASQPNQPQFQSSYSTAKEQLALLLQPESGAGITEFDIEIIQNSGLEELLPNHLSDKIEKSERSNELTPVVLVTEYQALLSKFQTSLTTAKSLLNTLEKLGATNIFCDNMAYLAFTLSSPNYDGSYKNYVADQKLFEEGLRFILNGSNVDDKTIKLLALSNTDPLSILAASSAGIILICKVLQEVLKIIQEGQKLLIYAEDLQSGRFKNEKLSKDLARHAKEKEDEAVTYIANIFIGEGDGERLTTLEKGIRKVMTSISNGNTIDVITGELEEESDKEIEKKQDTLTKKEFLEITKISKKLRAITGNDVPKYLLEGPPKNQEEADK